MKFEINQKVPEKLKSEVEALIRSRFPNRIQKQPVEIEWIKSDLEDYVVSFPVEEGEEDEELTPFTAAAKAIELEITALVKKIENRSSF